jgi:uncharacterized protein YqgV (UPF0045/DUF77 family)
MLAELRITPIGSKVPFARLIADLLPLLSESRLQYQVNPMGTTLAGDLPDILALVQQCHGRLRERTERVLIELSVDDRAPHEAELVRGLEHVRQMATEAPLERFVHHATH